MAATIQAYVLVLVGLYNKTEEKGNKFEMY